MPRLTSAPGTELTPSRLESFEKCPSISGAMIQTPLINSPTSIRTPLSVLGSSSASSLSRRLSLRACSSSRAAASSMAYWSAASGSDSSAKKARAVWAVPWSASNLTMARSALLQPSRACSLAVQALSACSKPKRAAAKAAYTCVTSGAGVASSVRSASSRCSDCSVSDSELCREAKASSSTRTSRALAVRCAGSGCMQARTRSASGAGVASGRRGALSRMDAMMALGVAPRCGAVPVSTSKSIAPSRYTSVRSLISSPGRPSISGAM